MSKFKVGQQVRVVVDASGHEGFFTGDEGVVVEKGHDNDFEWLVSSANWGYDKYWFENDELEAVK